MVGVYRPPKGGASAADFMKCLQSSLDDILVSSKSTVCLVGNFNAKNSTWWNGQSTTKPGVLLAAFAAAHAFVQMVDGATRAVATQATAQLG